MLILGLGKPYPFSVLKQIIWNFLSNLKGSSRLNDLNLDWGRPREPAISIRVPIWAQAISLQFTSTAIIEYRPCFRHCTKQ